jgi:hypothetical protein
MADVIKVTDRKNGPVGPATSAFRFDHTVHPWKSKRPRRSTFTPPMRRGDEALVFWLYD